MTSSVQADLLMTTLEEYGDAILGSIKDSLRNHDVHHVVLDVEDQRVYVPGADDSVERKVNAVVDHYAAEEPGRIMVLEAIRAAVKTTADPFFA